MISVLIPVYNTDPSFIKECFDSVYSQTLDKFEVVVVDNGSTNQSTIDELALQQSIRRNFNLFHVPQCEGKRNISLALNYGLSKCAYELVARIDSDDIMLENRLRTQFKFMHKNTDVDICGGQLVKSTTIHYSTPKRPTLSDVRNLLPILFHPTVMFRKNKILAIGGYQEDDPKMPEDLDLWIRCLENKYVITNLDETLVNYRIHNSNVSATCDIEYFTDVKNRMIDDILSKA